MPQKSAHPAFRRLCEARARGFLALLADRRGAAVGCFAGRLWSGTENMRVAMDEMWRDPPRRAVAAVGEADQLVPLSG
jgi:hypothetical protein